MRWPCSPSRSHNLCGAVLGRANAWQLLGALQLDGFNHVQRTGTIIPTRSRAATISFSPSFSPNTPAYDVSSSG
jgi:hypothetical protein